MNKLFLITAVWVAASLNVAAQTAVPAKDTTIKGATIEVIQSYKPEVKQRPKQEYTPALPPVDNSRPVFNYVVPQQTLNYTYNSLPLRPLALGKDTSLNPFPNYIKLGGGNLSTLFLDAGVGSIKGKDYETAFHLRSISQQGNIQYQKSSLTDFEADGTLHRNNMQWHGYLDVIHNQYDYYGYNHDLYQPTADSLKQAFTGVKAGVDMQKENTTDRFSYHPAVSVSTYSDKFNATENTIALSAPFYYKIDSSLSMQVAANGIITQYNISQFGYSNNIFQLVPGLNYHTGLFSAHAYLSPTIGINNEGFILPDLAAAYNIPKTLFTINAGWQATLRQNTYEQLSTENPYIFSPFSSPVNLFETKQTRSDEIYGGIQTNLGNHLSLSGRISWWRYDHLPVFVNNFGDQKQFDVLYDNNLNATSLQATITYRIGSKFAADAQGTFFNYYNGSYYNGVQGKPWEMPGVRIKGSLLYRPIPALTVTAYANILDQIYALENATTAVKLDPILDIGGGAEYFFIPRLSVFLQVTNLLNNKNERWLGYQSYDTNIYGGLRFKF